MGIYFKSPNSPYEQYKQLHPEVGEPSIHDSVQDIMDRAKGKYVAYRPTENTGDVAPNTLGTVDRITKEPYRTPVRPNKEAQRIIDHYDAVNKWQADKDAYLKDRPDIGVSEGFNSRIYDILHPQPKMAPEPRHWSVSEGDEKWQHQNYHDLGWTFDKEKAKASGWSDDDINYVDNSTDMNPYVIEDLQKKGIFYSKQRQYEEWLRQQELERQRALASQQAMVQSRAPQVAPPTPMPKEYAMHFAEAPMNPTPPQRRYPDWYYDKDL